MIAVYIFAVIGVILTLMFVISTIFLLTVGLPPEPRK